MSSGNLKALAMLAKQRLRNASTSHEKYNTVNDVNRNSYFYKNFISLKRVSGQVEYINLSTTEDYEFIDKVFSILKDNEDVLNPIAILTDKDTYDSLNVVEKEKYILVLADKYLRARNMYFSSKEKEYA